MTITPKEQVYIPKIREKLRASGAATRAELARHTGISMGLAQRLLDEMLLNNEITGDGREGGRFKLNRGRYAGAALLIEGKSARLTLLDLLGGFIMDYEFPCSHINLESQIIDALEEHAPADDLRAICLGVPGNICEDGYITRDGKRCAVGNKLQARFNLPVAVETDLNLTATGLGLRHTRKNPQDAPDLAYILFEDNYIGAGFLSGGKLIKSAGSHAGELGLMPWDGVTLIERLRAAKDVTHYSRLLAVLIKWVTLTLNPRYIYLGGPALRAEAVAIINETQGDAAFKLSYIKDARADCMDGLTELCVNQMFACE